MSSQLNTTPLSKCLSKVIDYRGKTPKKLGFDWSVSGYKAISANNVKFSGLSKLDSINYASEALYKKWMKEEIKKGDLLLTSEAPSGQIMLWDTDEKIILSQRLFGLRTNEVVYHKYLKYFLQSSIGQKEIFKNNSGSTVFGISAKTFPNISIHHPSYLEQIKIGDLLYSIDKKIDLNNRINDELLAIAKTLYNYWFVQFDFPDENGRPYKSSGGKLVYNPNLKHEIPAGWSVKKLLEVTSLIRRGISPKYVETGGTLVLNQKCIREQSVSFYESKRHKLELSNDEKLLQIYDVVVNSTGVGTLGRVAFIKRLVELKTTFDSHVSIVRANNDILSPQFLAFAMLRFQPRIEAAANGSTGQVELNKSFLQNLDVILPVKSIENEFVKFVTPLITQIASNETVSENLIRLRDWLLPVLMNGQVTLK